MAAIRRHAISRRGALGLLGGVAMAGVAAGQGPALASSGHRTLRRGSPRTAGLDETALAGIDDAVTAGLGRDSQARFPGAVVLVARHGTVAKYSAYGHAQTYRDGEPLPEPRPMRTDTVFDLASCTKVVATTAAVMRLVDTGRIALDAPAARWIGGLDERITVRRLLTHTAGLWEWQPTYLWARDARRAVDYVRGLPLRYDVGQDRHYSDLGFMLLGEIVRRETGQRLDHWTRRHIHRPLRMGSTGFRPGGPDFRFAATSFGNPYEQNMIATGEPYPILGDRGVDDFTGWRGHTLVGQVNDGNSAYAFDGVAGHAGLFATAWDVAVFAQMLLNGGGYGGFRLCGADTVAEFTRDQFHPGQGLGFWTHRFEGVAGLGDGGFGHSGFTGTEFAADPATGLVVVLLTNRLHPDQPHASVAPVWRGVREAVGRSLR
jgi:CubicO group peptidase (beta-lactamase class C family)